MRFFRNKKINHIIIGLFMETVYLKNSNMKRQWFVMKIN
jgi:hypothetical protein